MRAYVRTCEHVNLCMCAHFFFPSSSKCITHPLNYRRSIAKTTMFSQHTRAVFLFRHCFELYFPSLSYSMYFFTYLLFSCLGCVCTSHVCIWVFLLFCVKCRRSLHYYAFIMKIEAVCFIYSWHSLLCWCVVHIERIILFSIAPDLCALYGGQKSEREKERNGYNSNKAQQKCNNNTHRLSKETHLHEIYRNTMSNEGLFSTLWTHTRSRSHTMTIYYGHQRLKRHETYETLSNLHAQHQKYTIHRQQAANLPWRKTRVNIQTYKIHWCTFGWVLFTFRRNFLWIQFSVFNVKI